MKDPKRCPKSLKIIKDDENLQKNAKYHKI
jgi:hypothetical protein